MIFGDTDAFGQSGFEPQVVIIGAGPAGITLALRLAEARIPCALLEAGGRDYSGRSQDFYAGETIGDPYFELDVARLRYLGGTSGHWSGWCRPLDAHDFLARDWIAHSGWPIGADALAPHLPAARAILGLRGFAPDEPITDAVNRIDLIRSDPVVRFGDRFGDALERSPHIAVVLNAYATDLVARGRRVVAANLHGDGRASARIAAPRFVVAAGGIENARLLLWSNIRSPDPVVPEPRALGRYWMEHPEFFVGEAIIFDRRRLSSEPDGWSFFAPSPEAMAAGRIMNHHVHVRPRSYRGGKRLVADIACVAPAFGRWLANRADRDLICTARISVALEQAPVADNRVALSDDAVDPAGVPRVVLHWRKGDLERRTLVDGLKLFGTAMARAEFGRLKFDDWVLEGGAYPTGTRQPIAGHHHMGGTRMSADPRRGVVDADGRVHGMGNLYVAGSSVFTTSGYANPTLSIVALADRLGAHLAGEI